MGPFGDEREARRAAHTALPPGPGSLILTSAQNRQLLEQACEAARVDLGAYDRRVLNWLARWEESTVAVITGLIGRAYAAGTAARPAVGRPCAAFIRPGRVSPGIVVPDVCMACGMSETAHGGGGTVAQRVSALRAYIGEVLESETVSRQMALEVAADQLAGIDAELGGAR